jgi:nucleoside-diphosphate-sugar epimerase
MKIRNVLVTGASGKVGRHLIPALRAAGFHVRAMRHRNPAAIPGAEVVQGDIGDAPFVARALEDMDALCHLATTKEDPEHFLDVSVRGTFNLLEAARQGRRLQQFILAGGDCSLGIFYYENPIPLNESAPLRAYPGCYAFSKVLEEVMCQQYAIQYGLGVTNLRFSWIHAQDDILAHLTLQQPDFGSPWRGLAVTAAQKEYFQKGLDGVGCLVHPGGKAFVRHIVGIGDVVDAFLRALGNPAAVGQTFNIAAPAPFGYDVLSRYVAGRMNLPVVEFELAGRYDFAIDVAKARGVLGCPLKQDIFTIVEEAISLRRSGADANTSHGPASAPGPEGGST